MIVRKVWRINITWGILIWAETLYFEFLWEHLWKVRYFMILAISSGRFANVSYLLHVWTLAYWIVLIGGASFIKAERVESFSDYFFWSLLNTHPLLCHSRSSVSPSVIKSRFGLSRIWRRRDWFIFKHSNKGMIRIEVQSLKNLHRIFFRKLLWDSDEKLLSMTSNLCSQSSTYMLFNLFPAFSK